VEKSLDRAVSMLLMAADGVALIIGRSDSMLLMAADGVALTIGRSDSMLLIAADGVALMIGRSDSMLLIAADGVALMIGRSDSMLLMAADGVALIIGRSPRSVGVARALDSAVCTPERSEEAVGAILSRTEALVSGRAVGRSRSSESSVLEADWVLCVLLGV